MGKWESQSGGWKTSSTPRMSSTPPSTSLHEGSRWICTTTGQAISPLVFTSQSERTHPHLPIDSESLRCAHAICRLCWSFAEIYQQAPEYRRECSYYIALGYYKLGNYGHARKFNGTSSILYPTPSTPVEADSVKWIGYGCGGSDLLLHVEPSNRQAHSLKGLIDQAETREGYIGKLQSFALLR